MSAALFLECYSKVASEENRLSVGFIPLRIVPWMSQDELPPNKIKKEPAPSV